MKNPFFLLLLLLGAVIVTGCPKIKSNGSASPTPTPDPVANVSYNGDSFAAQDTNAVTDATTF